MTATLTETIIAASLTVLSNGLGGLPFVFTNKFPPNIARLGWAASGGLMLSASIFNLIYPGLDDGGIIPVAIGIALGVILMVITSIWLENRDIELEGLSQQGSRKILLVLVTLFIHSFPEGIAIGVAYGSGEEQLGILIAIAIAIHNIPEGLAVALPMASEGVSGWRTVFWAIVSGVPQILAAIPAYLAVRAFRPILPYAFGFAAGAMLLLVMSEMIPESRSSARERLSSAIAAMGGFMFMMLFQLVFGN
jgi:ZIP family zinc transporter